MAYHGNCCVCALTLCLCIFGSLTASTGVSLLMNAGLFDGNSSTPRTLPAGDWNQALGVTMTSGGSLMFLLGMLIAISCLTVGFKDKTDSSKLYDSDTPTTPSALDLSMDEPVVEVVKGSPHPEVTTGAKTLPQYTAYDVAFTPQDDTMNYPPVAPSTQPTPPDVPPPVAPSTQPTPPDVPPPVVTRWSVSSAVSEGSAGRTEEPRVDYPSVVLKEPTEDYPLNNSDTQPLFYK